MMLFLASAAAGGLLLLLALALPAMLTSWKRTRRQRSRRERDGTSRGPAEGLHDAEDRSARSFVAF